MTDHKALMMNNCTADVVEALAAASAWIVVLVSRHPPFHRSPATAGRRRITSGHPAAATESMSQDRQQMWAKPFYPPALRLPLSVPSIATTDRRAQERCGEVC